MNTWKIFITFILILVALPSLAQTLPISLEVRGGINISDVDTEFESSGRVNYRFEAVVDYNFANNIFIRSGLTFSDKKIDEIMEKRESYYDDYIQLYRARTRLSARYIQAPLMIGYKLDLNNKIKLNVAGGGYFAYGLNGNFNRIDAVLRNYSGIENGQSTTPVYEIDALFREGKTFKHMYNRFDTGLILSIGTEYRRFTLNAGYEYGLVDIAKYSEMGKIKTRNAFVALGFRIL